MIRKNLGFDLQKVTRQSLSSLEEVDRFYLDSVVSRLFERMANKQDLLFTIDDCDLKNYLSVMLRHYMIVHKIRSHIITIDENTSSLPYDVPFDNCVLIIDIQPNASLLYVKSLEPLVQACSHKNISIIILGCCTYDFEYLNSFVQFDAYDCLLSEHELRQITHQMGIETSDNLYQLTSGLPTLLRTWILSNDEYASFHRNELFQNSLIKALSWYMRESLSIPQKRNRIQLLLVGEDSYQTLSELKGFDLDYVVAPFTIASGRSISCAGWSDILTYRLFLETNKDLLYGMEGSIIEVLEYLYSHKKWSRLARALSIVPMNDIAARYVSKIPFEIINCDACKLIENAEYFERALSHTEMMALQMGEAAISGNDEALSVLLEEYIGAADHDKKIAEQAQLILDSYSLIRGKTPDTSRFCGSDNELMRMLKVHCDALELSARGDLETAYELILLHDNECKSTFLGQMLELDLMILSLLLGDDSWCDIEDKIHPVIEGLSSSGVVSVNLFAPVVSDCISCVFNQEMNSFALERAISTAQKRGYYLLSSWLLMYSVLYNLRIKNLIKAYTQANMLDEVSRKTDFCFLRNIGSALKMLSCNLLGEACENTYDVGNSDITPELVAVQTLVDAMCGKSIAVEDDACGSPSGIWWLLYSIEKIDESIIKQFMNQVHPSWLRDYRHYKVRIENLGNMIKEACEMNKAEEKLLKERNTLRIKVMGSIEIRSSGKEIREEDWTRKAAKMLLLYLSIAENHTLSRADLQELLWPDKDYIAARGNLYTALSSLKKTVGHNDELRPYIKCYEGYIALNPDCVRVDCDAFVRIARKMLDSSTDPDHIFALYDELVSTFDSGLFTPVGDESGLFQARKDSLESLYLETLMTVAELSLRLRRPRQAVRCAKEILTIDDRREDAFIIFIQALHSMGRRAEVVTAYNIFSKNLINRYGIAVSATTRDMYAEIIQDDSRPSCNMDAVG